MRHAAAVGAGIGHAGAGGTLHRNIQQMAQTTRWADSAAPLFPKEYAKSRKIWPFHLMAKKGAKPGSMSKNRYHLLKSILNM